MDDYFHHFLRADKLWEKYELYFGHVELERLLGYNIISNRKLESGSGE